MKNQGKDWSFRPLGNMKRAERDELEALIGNQRKPSSLLTAIT